MKSTIKFQIGIYAMLFLFFLGSCTNEEADINPLGHNDEKQSVELSKKAQEQVDGLFSNWTKRFANADLQPISIDEPQAIATEADVEKVINQITSSSSRYAYYDGENLSSMKVFTLESLRDNGEYMRAARKVTSSLIKVGQSYATINWTYNGEEFSTPFVFDNEGFVYEPMAASIAIKESNIGAAERSQWIQNFNINWVWGGKRGHVKIRHDITCNGTSLVGANGWSDAYMSLGSAQAEIITNGYTSSKSCTSWGYAWATSPISVSVSVDMGASGNYQGVAYTGKVNATINGSIGSSGKSTGFNMMQCY